jgi:hypothetical protein
MSRDLTCNESLAEDAGGTNNFSVCFEQTYNIRCFSQHKADLMHHNSNRFREM